MKKLILGLALMVAAWTAQANNYLYWTLDFSTLWSGTTLTSNPLLQPGETFDVFLIATKTDGSETVKFTDDSYTPGPTISSAADANIGGAAWTDVTSLGELQYWTFTFAIGAYSTGDWVVISEQTGYDVFKDMVTTDPTAYLTDVLNGAADTVWHYLPLTLQVADLAHGSVKIYTNGAEVAVSATPGEYTVESNSAVTVVYTADPDYAFSDGETDHTNVLARVANDPTAVSADDTAHWALPLYVTADGMYTNAACTLAFDQETTTWSVSDGTFTMNGFCHPGQLFTVPDGLSLKLEGSGAVFVKTNDAAVAAFTAGDVNDIWVTVREVDPETGATAEVEWNSLSNTYVLAGTETVAQHLVFTTKVTTKLTVDKPENAESVKVYVGDEEILPDGEGKYVVPTNSTLRVEYESKPGTFFGGTETTYVADEITASSDPVVIPEEKKATNPIVHTHCVCGKTDCSGTGHELTNWTCVATLPTTAGHYVLTNDIVISSTWHPVDGTYLCLAGHTITNTADSTVISNYAGEHFTLVDCTKSPGEVSGNVEAQGDIDVNGGTTIEGSVTGGTISDGDFSGKIVSSDITGGSFTNKIVDCDISGATFTGPVTASRIYGGVYLGTVAISDIYGGVFAVDPGDTMSPFTQTAVTVGDSTYYLVGSNVTVAAGKVVGGTFTFDPRNSEYEVLDIFPDNMVVSANGGEPATWTMTAEIVYYISADGDDSTGDGSFAKPYATLGAAYTAGAAITSTNAFTIALFSDITATSSGLDEQAVTVGDGKRVTITSADASGALIANAAGDYTGVRTLTRDGYGKYLVKVSGDDTQLILRQVKLDGNGMRAVNNSAGTTELDTNAILTGCGEEAIDIGGGEVTMKSNAWVANNGSENDYKAVALGGSAKLHVSDDVVVYNNIYGGNQQNVSAAANKIVVDGALGDDARIGLSIDSATAGMIVATGTTSYVVTDADALRFIDDTGAYKFIASSSNTIDIAAWTPVDDDRTLVFNGVTDGTNLVLTLDKAITGLTANDFAFTKNGTAITPDDVTITVTDGTNLVVSVAGVDLDGYTIGVKIANGGVKVNNGVEITKFYTTHSHDGSDYAAWEATDSLPTTAPTAGDGWFLKHDVQLTDVYVPVDSGMSLCLNGHTVTAATGKRVMTIPDGINLNLEDCSATPGKLTGGSADYGAGVYVEAGGALVVTDCEISGNTASVAGGGIYVLGNVAVVGSATVLDNTAAGNTNNVCLAEGVMLNLLVTNRTVGISTDPMPTATNTVIIGSYGTEAEAALYLPDDQDTVVRVRLDNRLELACCNSVDPESPYIPDPAAEDGVYDLEVVCREDGTATVSGFWQTMDPTKTLTIASPYGYRKEFDDMTAFTNRAFVLTIESDGLTTLDTVNAYFGESTDPIVVTVLHEHIHCVCGDDACSGTGHDASVEWRRWKSTWSLPASAGYFYLAHDVVLTNEYMPADGVVLCLAGHTISNSAANARVVRVGEYTTFTLTDCETSGCLTGGNGVDLGGGVLAEGSFNLYAGEISGNTATNGAGVAIGENGGVTLGGRAVVTGNTLTDGATANNLLVNTNQLLTLSADIPLTDDAEIGVTTAVPVVPYVPVTIVDAGTSAAAACFKSDVAGLECVAKDGALIVKVFDIEVVPESLTNATYQVLTNGAPVEKVGGKYLVPSNGTDVVIVYTPNEPYCFDDGESVKTNAVDTSTDPSTNPAKPLDPSVKITSEADLAMAVEMLEDEADGCTVKWYIANDITVEGTTVIAKNDLKLTIIGDGHTLTASNDCPSVFTLVATNGSAAVYTFADADTFADNRSETYKTTTPLVNIVTDSATVTLTNPELVDLEPVTLSSGAGYSFHQHYVCGEHECEHAGHDKVTITWQKWTETNSLPATAGYWYLDNDVTLTNAYAATAGVELCLNGKKLDLNGQTFTVADGVDFLFHECRGVASVTNGTITVAEGGELLLARGGFAAVAGDGLVAVPNEMTNVVVNGAFSPKDLDLGTNAVVKMGADFSIPSVITVTVEDDLVERGNIKVFEPADGVTGLDLEALAAKVVAYDPEFAGNKAVVIGNAIYLTACFQITYEAMDGEFADGDTVKKLAHYISSGYEFPDDPTRANYGFAGWYLSWTNGAAKVENGDLLNFHASHTLYAKWISTAMPGGATVFESKERGEGAAVMLTGPKTNESGVVESPFADGNLVLPERLGNSVNGPAVEWIAAKAFCESRYDAKVDDSEKLRSVTLSTYITRIGDSAFKDCTLLTNVTFANTRDYVTNAKTTLDIGSRAFENSAIEKLVIPAGVSVKLRANSFANCTKLREICVYGELLGTETAPFAMSGDPDAEVLIRLSPEYAQDTNFVANLTKNLNTSRVTISSEPLGQVEIESFAKAGGEVTVTFKADFESPWGVVNENSVTLFYTDDLTKGFVGNGKYVYPDTVTGPDGSGVYTAVFTDPSSLTQQQYYRVTVGAERD